MSEGRAPSPSSRRHTRVTGEFHETLPGDGPSLPLPLHPHRLAAADAALKIEGRGQAARC